MSEKNPMDWKCLSFYLPQLKKGVINEVPLNTEITKPSRNVDSSDEHTPIEANKSKISKVIESLSKLCLSTISYLETRIVCPPLIQLIEKTFDSWDSESLKSLIDISKSSGRSYSQEEILIEQFCILKEIF